MSKPRVIVISGTTGVGKSDLSIQLAKNFNGEIINSDSMQMYNGIPIITNKHPIEQRSGIQHHIMNHVPWTEEYYIHRFETECMNAISDIHRRGKVPIIVGGTHYYLQTLFNKRIDTKVRTPTLEEAAILSSNDPDLIYNNLKKVDPVIASKFHINDTRRVKRMLEIFYTTGEKPSKHYEEQDISLKYDTLFLWIYSQPETLDQRLDDRVDTMLSTGGLEEIKELYAYYKKHKLEASKLENGVWQVIGFKEFLPWLDQSDNADLADCIEKMKIRTKQYAKKQVKWIKKMLIPDVNGQVYVLDATDLSEWDANVSSRATEIVADFINDRKIEALYAPPNLQELLNHESKNSPKCNQDWQQYSCNICKDKNDKMLVAIGAKNWEIHLKSRRHKANLNKKSKKHAYEEWQRKKIIQETI